MSDSTFKPIPDGEREMWRKRGIDSLKYADLSITNKLELVENMVTVALPSTEMNFCAFR